MAWLRVDDGMTEHRKVLALPRKDRWTWLELLTYVARQNNGGHVPQGVSDVLRWVTPSFLNQCSNAGLLDTVEGGYVIHDWDDYNPKDPSNADRQKRYRQRHRNDESNGEVTEEVTEGVTPPARAGARVPSPTPTPTPITTPAATTSTTDPGPDAAALYAAGWSQSQIHQAADDLPRANALLAAAKADPTCSSPGALAWTKFKAGETPTEQPQPKTCPECGIVIRPPTTVADHLWQTHDIEVGAAA